MENTLNLSATLLAEAVDSPHLGQRIMIEPVTPDSYFRISEIAERNFRDSFNFRYFSDELRAKYIRANSQEKIRMICEDPLGFLNLRAIINREVVGYMFSKKLDKYTIWLRRAHVIPEQIEKGIGSLFLERIEAEAKKQGHTVVMGGVTGEAYNWLLSRGYRIVGGYKNTRGVFSEGEAPICKLAYKRL